MSRLFGALKDQRYPWKNRIDYFRRGVKPIERTSSSNILRKFPVFCLVQKGPSQDPKSTRKYQFPYEDLVCPTRFVRVIR